MTQKVRWACLFNSFICYLSFVTLTAQDCTLPLLLGFDDYATNTVRIDWLDFNTDEVTWDIEHGQKGFVATGSPTISGLTMTSYVLTGLSAGTAYEIYLRANCNLEGYSEWNGPYFINTVISNNRTCGLSLEIPDNSCPRATNFLIDVAGYPNMTIGDDIMLEHLDLIVTHPWPPDLSISLVSPDGQAVLISEFNGSGTDDYGSLLGDDCSVVARFSDNACESITDISPPFQGDFQAEESLASAFSGSPIDGLWQLKVCDRASSDIGQLQYVDLSFSESACVAPPSFTITDIEADNVSVAWNALVGCTSLEINYKKKSDPVQLSSSEYVECNKAVFQILGLLPDTEYELTIRSECGTGEFSPLSCRTLFTTACSNSILKEEFDEEELCISDCSESCNINAIWKNQESNDTYWLINEGRTQTSFTGPDVDRKGKGSYLYIDTQENSCVTSTEVHLISDCLYKPGDEACALSFSYHMLGLDIGSLEVAYSTDSVAWTVVWSQSGDRGNAWQFGSVDIPIAFNRGLLRFSAQRKNTGVRGDIAIDNIKLIGIDTITPLRVYADSDGDGYGDLNQATLICASTLPLGYALNADDCDDTNAAVNPSRLEIACNNLDDDCNGLVDDVGSVDIQYIVGSVSNETCQGAGNGIISIQATNGQAPYTYTWNNGEEGRAIADLSTGIYTCTITDVGGCQLVTDPIFLDFDDLVVYSVRDFEGSSCIGNAEGSIQLRIEGGDPPYKINWSNGRFGTIISGLDDGVYYATITDSGSCKTVIDSVVISSPQILTAGVLLKRDNDCYGGSTGFIQLRIEGGSPPYNIAWNNGEDSNVISNLPTGFYDVTITDQQGCENVITSIEIQEPEALAVEVTAQENVTCAGGSDSFVDIKVSGGTAPFAYFWSDGSLTQDIVQKPAGVYSVTVSDIQACSAVLSDIIISEPDPLSLSVDALVNVACAGSKDGFVEIKVEGGTQPYEYNWGIFDGDQFRDNALDSLSPGSYSLTVVDNFDCKSKAFSVDVLSNNQPLLLTEERLEDVKCAGDSTGVLSVFVRDGLAPFDFNWSTGSKLISDLRLDTISNLISGSYNVTVTDAEGCVGISDSIQINEVDPLRYEVVEIVDNDCWNENDGAISLIVSGGTQDYNYAWSNGSSTASINNLSNEIYTATITDSEDCRLVTNPFSINSPEPVTVNLSLEHPSTNMLGVITAMAIGGTGNLTYQWASPLTGITDNTVANLSPGNYLLSIIDELGCRLDTTITLDFRSSTILPNSEESIRLYPNPASTYITVEYGHHLVVENLAIYSSSGIPVQLVELSDNNQAHYDLNIEDLAQGLYYLEVQSRTGRYLTKFLVLTD